MAQKDNSVNFFIRDANGQPQMIKVVQSSVINKQPVGPIQLPVFKHVNVTGFKGGSKLVPVQTISQLQKVTVVNPSVQTTSAIRKVQTQPSAAPKQVVNPVNFVQQPVEETQPMATTPVEKKPNISRLIVHTRKRHDSEADIVPEYTTKRRKAADKVGKGLRHFSMKVCEKVRKKGFTSYNEVADELVAEFTAGLHGSETQQFDQKNIRRRVYDALNVLMAMNIISKEKKEIRWLGLPTNSAQECTTLEKEKKSTLERIQQKTQQLHDLILQQISFKNLVERNKAAENRGMTPSQASSIQLPFIVVNTSDKALIDCSISHDKMEYVFNFNEKFQIYDDIEILKRMGLLMGLDKGQCSEEDIKKVKSMVPKSLEHYIERLGRGIELDVDDLLNVNDIKTEELSESEELDIETEDSYGGNYSDDDEQDQDEAESTSDVDINGEMRVVS